MENGNPSTSIFCLRGAILRWAAMLLLALTELSLEATPAEAQDLPPPALSAKVLRKNRGVELRVKLPRGLQGRRTRRLLSVVIERDSGGGFVPIAQFNRPQTTSKFRDASALNGGFLYRAFAAGPIGLTGYSPTVPVINLAPGPNPPAGATCHDVRLPAGLAECPAGYEDAVVNEVNAHRAGAGAPPLVPHRSLNCAARNHTIWMIQNGNFSHDGWVEFIRAAGYTGGMIGENIAIGFPTPSAVMGGWMGSSGHRSNIMNGGFSDLGVACLIGRGTVWWTQNFGGR